MRTEDLMEYFRGLDPTDRKGTIATIMDREGITEKAAAAYFARWKAELKKQSEEDEEERIREYAKSIREAECQGDPRNAPSYLKEINRKDKAEPAEALPERERTLKNKSIQFDGDNGHYTITAKEFTIANEEGSLTFSGSQQWAAFKREIDEAFEIMKRMGGLLYE